MWKKNLSAQRKKLQQALYESQLEILLEKAWAYVVSEEI